MVDNSILAPVFQQPLALGADISMTSGTKFIGGHSDITAGILSVKNAELAKQVYFFQVKPFSGRFPCMHSLSKKSYVMSASVDQNSMPL